MEIILNSAFLNRETGLFRVGINCQFQSDSVVRETFIQEIEIQYPDGHTVCENWGQVIPEHRLGKMEDYYYLNVPEGTDIRVTLCQNRADQKFPVNIIQLLECRWSGVAECQI